MGRPAVSVVVPAYNRAASIGLALESVLRQSFADLELIVVDDGSTDGTRDVVRAMGDPRLRLIETPRNMGASAARNLGTEAATADWVAFQDSDDEWLPLKLEKQMARLAGSGFVAGYCGMLILDEPDGDDGAPGAGDRSRTDRSRTDRSRIASPRTTGRMAPRYFPPETETEVEGDLLEPLLRTSLISTQTLVARRDRLLAIGGFDPEQRSLIDWDCVIRLAPLGPIAFVDEPLVFQRFSRNSITRDAARRLASQIRIVEKHAAALAPYPKIHAWHHFSIAGAQRMAGDLPAARASLARARALDPGNPRYLAMALGVGALGLMPEVAAKRVARRAGLG